MKQVRLVSKDTFILAIETSCDETSASVVKNGRCVLSNVISSQIDTHVIYGGVVPEIASRKHIQNIDHVVNSAMSGMSYNDIDAVAVTSGPGLVGALLVGVSYAKALAFSTGKPLVSVHHIEGHLCANYLENDFTPPYIVLIASGGHTHLIEVFDYGMYSVLGKTFDDAAGEAFDKVARVLGLGYPGGPKIDNLAKEGNPLTIPFPRAFKSDNNYDFSFSGLKSAVLNYINKAGMTGQIVNKADVAASFQLAVTDVLVNKTINAAISRGVKRIALAGGVASNSALRNAMSGACCENNFSLQIPKPVYCTDNAAMIASAGYFKYLKGEFAELSLNAYPNVVLH